MIIAIYSCANTGQPERNASDASAQITDQRDQRIYKTVNIGQQKWLAEDLQFETPESFCYDNDPKNCTAFGRLYDFAEAQTACPQGWKLPADEDWKKLEMHLGMEKAQADAIRVWRGTKEGDALKKQLQVVLTGMGKMQGREFVGQNALVRYWVNTPGPTGEQFALFRMVMDEESRIYSDQVARMDLCCVRCLAE